MSIEVGDGACRTSDRGGRVVLRCHASRGSHAKVVLVPDECWFRDAYKGAIVFNVDAKVHDVDRNDGVYAHPRPHWDGTFVNPRRRRQHPPIGKGR